MNSLWTTIAADAGVSLSDAQLGQLDAYLDGLIEKNKVLNLTRITDKADAEVKHVADALTLLKFIPESAVTLADVGTGGGIPGVILAIARPQMRVTLIDATRKKLDAVQGLCDAVGVHNVTTHHGRMEQVELKFDVVTARAVAAMGKLLGWCRPLLKRGGVLLALKGPRVSEEIAAMSGAQKRQWTLSTHTIDVPALAGHVVVQAKSKGP